MLIERPKEQIKDLLGLCDPICGVKQELFTSSEVPDVLKDIRAIHGIKRSAGINKPSVNAEAPASDMTRRGYSHCEAAHWESHLPGC